MSENYTIKDKLQQLHDLSRYSIVRDILLLCIVFYSYKSLPQDSFFSLIRLYVIFICLRYALSELTEIRDTTDKQAKHFQLSGHFGLFLLVVIYQVNNIDKFQNNSFLSFIIIFSFGFLNILTRHHTSADIVLTYLFITFLYEFAKSKSFV